MIAAVILAAGQSTRMKKQKMLLPWGDTTVIEKVVSTLSEGDVDEIQIIVGGTKRQLVDALRDYKIKITFNPYYENGEMLTSLQVGIKRLGDEIKATLVVLGDQPQIESGVIRRIIERYRATNHKIIVPSYKMRRGHPFLIDRSQWNTILHLAPPDTLRDYLNENNNFIDYIVVETPSVIQDLDTPHDYILYKP